MADNHIMLKKIKSWIPCNIVAVILVLIFISIYFVFRGNDDACFNFGAAGMDYLNREYYRWITCLFLHYNIGHLFVNSAAFSEPAMVCIQSTFVVIIPCRRLSISRLRSALCAQDGSLANMEWRNA